MMRKLKTLILFLAIPVSVIFANQGEPFANPVVTDMSKQLVVEVDYTKIQDGTAIGFSSVDLNGTDYDLYDTHKTELKDSFPLNIVVSQEKGIHAEASALYIRWKVYTNKSVDITLRAKEAMTSPSNLKLPVNWRIELVSDSSQYSGSCEAVAEAGAYEKQVPIFSAAAQQNVGCGSVAFCVYTEPLSDKHFDLPYEGSIVANITIN